MTEAKKVVWNPLVARLADAEVKRDKSVMCKTGVQDFSKIKTRWVDAAKRRSPAEFEKYIHDLFISDL